MLEIDTNPSRLLRKSLSGWNYTNNVFATNNRQNKTQQKDFGMSQNILVPNINEKSDSNDTDDLWTAFCLKKTDTCSSELSSPTNQNRIREITVPRKRKRTIASRISSAMKFLKETENNNNNDSNNNNDNSTSYTSNYNYDSENETIKSFDDHNHNNTITSKNCQRNKNLLNNDTWNQDDFIWQDAKNGNSNQIILDIPYYMTGFPNPPGENRCWLNATLHALFVLPLIDYLNHFSLSECSRLTKTLIAMQLFWKQGVAEKEKTYQTLKKFKDELRVLDESYSSKKQQDVSEFLMIFLNYVRSECEKLITETNLEGIEDIENLSESHRNQISIDKMSLRPLLTSKKRMSLTSTSPLKERNNPNADVTVQLTHITYPLSLKHDESLNSNNPIDEFFLLHMIEHYICQGCDKHRQRNIDNLMLYIDLLSKDDEPLSLTQLIFKSMEPEERNFICVKCKYNKHNVSTTFRGCPNVLIIQINRYGMTQEGIVEKINAPVDIPSNLKINDSNNMIHNFQPICIIAHVGNSIDYGHYTSYVKHADQWFHYNDMDVTPMTECEALNAGQTTAYLVFFINTKLFDKLNFLSVKIEDEPLR